MNNRCWKNIATLGPIGNLPMPGTMASFCTLICVALFAHVSFAIYLLLLIGILCLGLYAIHKSLHTFTVADPPHIVIDEVVGCMITFFAISLNYKSAIIGFCLFRFFDISKRCGVKLFERLNGTSGIMLDDVWAGLLSNLILHALHYSSWLWHV
jgi:phosphatidylglycerophosphatase A